MAKIKVGTEKCPHPDKKTGRPDCEKLGRFNPKPIISWNSTSKFDTKRKYYQFIHNDGTRHNISTYKDHKLYQLDQKDDPLGLAEFSKWLISVSEECEKAQFYMNKVAAQVKNFPMTQEETIGLKALKAYANTESR